MVSIVGTKTTVYVGGVAPLQDDDVVVGRDTQVHVSDGQDVDALLQNARVFVTSCESSIADSTRATLLWLMDAIAAQQVEVDSLRSRVKELEK